MRVAALRVELHLATSQSLKEKRALLRPFIEGIRRLGSYSVSEVDHHDRWQRAAVGIAIVAPDGEGLAMQVSKLRRYLDKQLEVDVLEVLINELEEPDERSEPANPQGELDPPRGPGRGGRAVE
jgi:uncharacterized protein YlxP (DUF503 family)